MSDATTLEVLDLFAGLEGWSTAFRDRGHRTTTLDFDPRFKSDHVRDILSVRSLAELERDGQRFDVVLASPPCESFSVMTIGRNWTRDHEPKTDAARLALRIAHHTFDLIRDYAPRWWVVENPRGKMRRVEPAWAKPHRVTTWYCRWGLPYAKPTDLWTNLKGAWPVCENLNPDHSYAPRGSRAGVQGVGEERQYTRPDGKRDSRAIRDAITRGDEVKGWKLIERRGRGTVLVQTGQAFGSRLATYTERSSILEAIQRGERVPGWRLSKDGRLRRLTRFEFTSGTRPALRALVPYDLALAVCLAAESDGIVRSTSVAQMSIALEAARG